MVKARIVLASRLLESLCNVAEQHGIITAHINVEKIISEELKLLELAGLNFDCELNSSESLRLAKIIRASFSYADGRGLKEMQKHFSSLYSSALNRIYYAVRYGDKVYK